MPDPEFEEILARAAQEGAKRALADADLDCKEAALDIRDLRSLLDCIRFVRRTAGPDRRPSHHHQPDPRAARGGRPEAQMVRANS